MSDKHLQLADNIGFASLIGEFHPRIERALEQHLPLSHTSHNIVFQEALRAAVFPGGKRFRAVLALLASELVFAHDDDALTAAVAVEYLHSSALIFDDLPAMDDAHERRGHDCLHLRYGEGLAIVVALALMNASYRVVAGRAPRDTAPGQRALRELMDCVGAQIAGQAADLASSLNHPADVRPGDGAVRHWKTSGLLRLALTLGPTLSGATSSDVAALSRFGELLGKAYQTVDDARDIDEDTALLERGREATFAMEHGCERAIERAVKLQAEAQRELVERLGDLPPVYRLCEFANSLLT